MSAGLTGDAEQFRVLARRIRDAGEGGLQRELRKGIRDAAVPAMQSVRRSLPEYMPGAYAEVLGGDLTLSVSVAPSRVAAVAIRGTTRIRRRSIRRVEAGILAHPLFGNRKHWYYQSDGVRAGFFSDPLARSAPQIRDGVATAMARIAARITEG